MALTYEQRIARQNDRDDAALAELRLAELNSTSSCHAEVQDLQKRLDKIVDIERSLDGNGHAPAPHPAR